MKDWLRKHPDVRTIRVAAVDLSEAGLAETAALASGRADRLTLHALSVSDRAAVEAIGRGADCFEGVAFALATVASRPSCRRRSCSRR